MHLPDPFRRTERGFTLIEVLISMSILAGLTAIMWVAIKNIFDTRDFITERYERFQIMRVALDRMNTEIASAYLAGPSFGAERRFDDKRDATGSGSGGSARQQTEEAQREALEAEREPVAFGMRGEEDELHFTTFAHMRTVEGERTSHHAEIGYYLKEVEKKRGEGTVQSLVRRIDTTYDDDITEGGEVYTLVPNVEDVEFEYWDPGDIELGTEEELGQGSWTRTWDTSQREHYKRLPTRVKITITLPAQGPRGEEETFTTQTRIMTSQRLEF